MDIQPLAPPDSAVSLPGGSYQWPPAPVGLAAAPSFWEQPFPSTAAGSPAHPPLHPSTTQLAELTQGQLGNNKSREQRWA